MSKQATVEGNDPTVTRELKSQLESLRAALASEPDKYSDRAERMRVSIEEIGKRLAKRA